MTEEDFDPFDLVDRLASAIAEGRCMDSARLQAEIIRRLGSGLRGPACGICGGTGLAAYKFSGILPRKNASWEAYNVSGSWGHEPTARGLYEDGYEHGHADATREACMSDDGLKLYAFNLDGFGGMSFFVCAKSFDEAFDLVKDHPDYEGRPFELVTLSVGEVATHTND